MKKKVICILISALVLGVAILGVVGYNSDKRLAKVTAMLQLGRDYVPTAINVQTLDGEVYCIHPDSNTDAQMGDWLWVEIINENQVKVLQETGKYMVYAVYDADITIDLDTFSGILTNDGHIWDYSDENIADNTQVVVTFDDNGTAEYLYDDTIISVRKA